MSDLRSRGAATASGRPPAAMASSSSVPWTMAADSANGESLRATTLFVDSSSSSSSSSSNNGNSICSSNSGTGSKNNDTFLWGTRDLPRSESDADKRMARMHAHHNRPRSMAELLGLAIFFSVCLLAAVHLASVARDFIAPSLQDSFIRRGSFRSNSLDYSANAADGDDDAVGEGAGVSEPHLDAEAEALARSRQTAVRDAFLHAWRGYKTYAWGKDSLHPKTKRGSDDFLGMAISILDSMDTALIMNLDDVFEEQYAWVVQELKFGHQEDINVFETTIRVVGGLLSAYALSGRTPLLNLADDLGQRLLPAFDSKTGIPYGTLGLKTGKKYNPSWVSQASSVAEAGTLQMEFRYLAKLTGKREYRNKVDRVLHFFEKQMRTGSSSDVYDGLFPMYVHPETGRATGEPIITFGARGDSLYEYFLKSYLQSDRSEQWLLQMYETSMTGMTNHLLHQTSGPERYTYIAELNMKKPYDPIKKMDHLVCFVPGMLALGSVRGAGSKVAHDRARSHLAIAERLMRTCYSMYSTTATGLAPEIAHMDQPSSPELMPKNGAKHSLLRPETVESLFILWRVTKKQRYRDWGWEIFRAIENHARVSSGGYSGIADVTQVPPKLNDKMDSFFLAETLKYLYLLYAPDDLIPLDKYVFSTEAHPLPVFQWDE